MADFKAWSHSVRKANWNLCEGSCSKTEVLFQSVVVAAMLDPIGSPTICVYKFPLNKIHYKIHFNNISPCIFCFSLVHLSKLVPRLHCTCLHACGYIHRTSQRWTHVNNAFGERVLINALKKSKRYTEKHC